jgi:hypothetical protein
MALFRREAADYDERRYLQRLSDQDQLSGDELHRFIVLAHNRKEQLVNACFNQISHLATCQADRYGEPLTYTSGVDMAVARVKDLLWQDRSLYAWVTRDALLNLHGLLSSRFEGTREEGMEAAVESVGLSGAGTRLSEESQQLPEAEQQQVFHLGEQALDIFYAMNLPDRPPPRDRTLYENLFRSAPVVMEARAHEVIAWCGIVLGRLCASGRLRPTIIMTDPDFDVPPPMDKRGWYPNPYNRGTKNLIPRLERYWDGKDWTDQFRALEDWGWKTSIVPLRSVPPN